MALQHLLDMGRQTDPGEVAAANIDMHAQVLPVLPTTPFVLLAAWFFSKGSKRLHAWLLSSKTFGPIILDWERHGVIRPRAKALSLTMMALLFGYTLIFVDVKPAVKIVVARTFSASSESAAGRSP